MIFQPLNQNAVRNLKSYVTHTINQILAVVNITNWEDLSTNKAPIFKTKQTTANSREIVLLQPII